MRIAGGIKSRFATGIGKIDGLVDQYVDLTEAGNPVLVVLHRGKPQTVGQGVESFECRPGAGTASGRR